MIVCVAWSGVLFASRFFLLFFSNREHNFVLLHFLRSAARRGLPWRNIYLLPVALFKVK
jgi:hypothetical protein